MTYDARTEKSVIPPSPALLEAVRAMARRERRAVPRGATRSAAICRAFLWSSGLDAPPSHVQLMLAAQLAARLGEALPAGLSGRELLAWIGVRRASSKRSSGTLP